jgi:glycosyltransferase involved in cell wall biosynthesis
VNILYLSFSQGGLDTSVMVLGEELIRQGHRVSVLYGDAVYQTPSFLKKSDKFNIYHVRISQFHYYLHKLIGRVSSFPRTVQGLEFFLNFKTALNQILKKEKIDLVEVPEIFVAPGMMRGIPYIVRLHSADWTWRSKLGEKKRFSDKWDPRLEAVSLKGAAGISSPSHDLGKFIRSECRIDRPVEVIPYPVDMSRFKPVAGKTFPPTILFVGRVEKRKGADVLLGAVPQILAKIPDCRFVFIGSISEDVKTQIAEASPQVSFLSMIPHEALPEWYQRAAIFVAPSRWDNSPNTIYEAMACGTPVVASRVGGIPEVIDDGVSGLLVSPGDSRALGEAIISLLLDKPRLEKMGQRAYEKALNQYAAEKISERTIAFYKQALART